MLDLYIYKIYNDDLKHLNDTELKEHFENVGKNEKRIYNLKSLSEIAFDNYEDYNLNYFESIFRSTIISDLIKSKNNKNKLKVFIFSNCQGNHISLLNKIEVFNNYFEFVYLQNYINIDDYDYLQKIINTVDIFIYQTIRQSGIGSQLNYILNNIDNRVFKISLSYFYCNWYWLFGTSIIDSLSSLDQYKNKNIINRDDIYNILKHHDFNLKDRMELSFKIFEEKEYNVDIKILPFIRENYKKFRLFFNKNHITKPVIIYFINEVLKKLKINILIDNTIDIGVYNNNYFQPISSLVKQSLNLEFEEDSIGDDFYIDFFNDYVNNNASTDFLIEKYENNENPNIYIMNKL